jgi:alpha-1,6-mannosyltransferase
MWFLFNINFFWIFTALSMLIISLVSYKGNPLLEDSSYYFAFQITYLAIVLIGRRLSLIKKVDLHHGVFFIGIVLVCFSQPLFENDHYRYLWEGRVFANGVSPYEYAPSSKELDNISFNKKESIGFKHLSSIYPPVALAWFSLGGMFSPNYRVGLIILMILNSLLIFLMLKRLLLFDIEHWLIILTFPILQKEYIQSIHIDLFAFIWILPFLLGVSHKLYTHVLLIFMSVFSKIIGVFFVFPLFLKFYKGIKHKFLLCFYSLFLLISFPAFYYFVIGVSGNSGFKAFSSSWIWNPGFYSFLNRFLNIGNTESRYLTIYSFLFYLFLIGIRSIRCFLIHDYSFTKKDLWSLSYLFFSGFIFFSPVYNSWYVIWFLVPALLLNLQLGVLYAFFSFTCYTKYLNPSLIPLGEFFGHILFIPSLVELYRSNHKDSLEG